VKDLILFKHELQNIINRNEYKGEGGLIKTVQTYLKTSLSAGSKAEGKQHARAEEERALFFLRMSIIYGWIKSVWVPILRKGQSKRFISPGILNML
jgi:hypothetical protein